MNKKVLIILGILLLLLGGYRLKDNYEVTQEYKKIYDDFVDNFTENNPEYILLDSVMGAPENYPIMAAGIGQNKETGASSTLFIVDDSGVAQHVGFGNEEGKYREEDGLSLDENTVVFSLSFKNEANQNEEIHDIRLSFTKKGNDIFYTNDGTIRWN